MLTPERTKAKESGGTSSSSPSLPGGTGYLRALLPLESPFLHLCPPAVSSCFGTAAARPARHEQFYLPLLTGRGLSGRVLT